MTTFRLVFRTDKHGPFTGDPVAVYDEPLDRDGMLSIYEHMGQHGRGALEWYGDTRAATPEEYAPLLREMTGNLQYAFPGAEIIVGKRLTNTYKREMSR